MSTLSVPASVLAATFVQLRECGAGRRECVVYWCADRSRPDQVAAVVHPEHTATLAGYQVDSQWVTGFFLDLRAQSRRVAAQVHTHPGHASHSEVDDTFALAPQTDFLSLVIPDFATGPVTLRDTHLVQMEPSGSWVEVPPRAVLIHE